NPTIRRNGRDGKSLARDCGAAAIAARASVKLNTAMRCMTVLLSAAPFVPGWRRNPSACPGKVDTGFPRRTRANERILATARGKAMSLNVPAWTCLGGLLPERLFAAAADARQRDRHQ